MGRIAGTLGGRRGVLRRPILLFAAMLLGPAAGLAWLGWQSVEREHAARAREVRDEAAALLEARAAEVHEALERVRRREEARPYFEYQEAFLPLDRGGGSLAFQPSPLLGQPSDPLVRGWFQWELYGEGVVLGEPEVLPREAQDLTAALAGPYRAALKERLEGAPADRTLRRVPAVPHPQWNVAGNEERGRLLEELDVAQRRAAEPDAAPATPDEGGYLGQWLRRARDEPISVRTTALGYLYAPDGEARGVPLLAWRLVWIPGERTERREVKRDRWLLQGYAVDPAPLLPAEWTRQGRVRWIRAAAAPGVDGPDLKRRSLLDGLGAEPVARPPGPRPAALGLLARPDPGLAAGALTDARQRFLLLLGGLVLVVALGFAVLVRGVRREVDVLRRKEDFVAAITHELRTPLAGIRMYAEMLKEGWVETPEAAEGYAGRILDETERLGQLVNQVLDLAALERGVATVSAVPGDLGEAVRQAAAWMERRAREAGVALAVEVEPDLPPVPFDPRWMRPLVLNLLDNAIKYSARSPHKEVRVTLGREGERLVLAVADRGVGIDAATRRRLFRPFQRAGDELTREAPGLGIGLALVKRYAEAHRARVTLESTPGAGTRVEVRFPISAA